MTKEDKRKEVINHAINVLGLDKLKTSLNIWTELEKIWDAGYEAGEEY